MYVVDLNESDMGYSDEFIKQNYDKDDLQKIQKNPPKKEAPIQQNNQGQSEQKQQSQEKQQQDLTTMEKEAKEKLKKMEEELTQPEVHPNDKFRIVNDETQRTIYVGNISLNTVDDDLRDLFKQFGSIERIQIAKSKHLGVKGYAHIVFREKTSQQKALGAKDNNVILDGKKLLISQARGMQPKNICINCGSSIHTTLDCPQGNAGKNCFLCGKYGHVSKHCPKNYSRFKQQKCFKCGKEGHTLHNCPQNQSR